MNVSFVMPAFKRRFLKEAISSILAQTRPGFELVVVDDASPEDLKQIVDGFRDGRLKYIRNDANIGARDLVAAWRKAMSCASGDWIVLAGDDDVYAPDFLENMVELAQRHPGVDLVHSRVKIINAGGTVEGLSPAKPEVESAISLMFDRVVRGAEQFVPEFMFRRSRMEEIGGFVSFPKAWYSDDATWALMAANGCANCNEPLFSFRYSGVNISTSYARVFDQVEAGCRYFDWAKGFLAKASPSGEVEAWMLGEIKRQLESRVYGLICRELDRTSIGERLRTLKKSSMSGNWKRRYVLHALKRLLCR